MKFTLEQLKELKGKTLFCNVNGAVIACRFTRLEVYLSGNYSERVGSEYADHYRYTLEFAGGISDDVKEIDNAIRLDGNKFGQYHGLFPKLYYTIDDCVNCQNCLGKSVVHQFAAFKNFMCGTNTHNDVIGVPTTWALTWRRNKETFLIEQHVIGMCRYDVLKDKLYVGCGPTYEEKVCYRTKEECANSSPIQVITFD